MLAARDAEDLFRITDQSRDYLREWLPWVDATRTVEDSQSFIKNSFQIYGEQTGMTAGIFYKGALAGVAGFNQFDWKNKTGYIGYWLASSFQGNGIMTRAVRTLTDHAFTDLQLNRVDIRAAKDNRRSRAIPERLGFTQEGQLRQTEWLYDHYVDHIVYGMLASEWN
jgi:ribosomal-protein-serine acetyltransferase